MLLVAAIAEGLSLLALALAFLLNFGAPSTVLAVFLAMVIVSTITAALAMILALVGLFKYRRYTVWFVLILGCSIVFNPMIWMALLVLLA